MLTPTVSPPVCGHRIVAPPAGHADIPSRPPRTAPSDSHPGMPPGAARPAAISVDFNPGAVSPQTAPRLGSPEELMALSAHGDAHQVFDAWMTLEQAATAAARGTTPARLRHDPAMYGLLQASHRQIDLLPSRYEPAAEAEHALLVSVLLKAGFADPEGVLARLTREEAAFAMQPEAQNAALWPAFTRAMAKADALRSFETQMRQQAGDAALVLRYGALTVTGTSQAQVFARAVRALTHNTGSRRGAGALDRVVAAWRRSHRYVAFAPWDATDVSENVRRRVIALAATHHLAQVEETAGAAWQP